MRGGCTESAQRVHRGLWWGHVANYKHPRMHKECTEGAQRVHGGCTESAQRVCRECNKGCGEDM